MPWKEFCAKGVWVGPAYQYHKYGRIFQTPSRKWEFYSGNLERLLRRGKSKEGGDRLNCLPHYESVRFLGDQEKYPLTLVTYQPLLTMENGSQNYPWAQEIFLVMHGVGWTNLVEVNSQTARGLGIKDGDRVWVESPFSRIEGRARVSEGIHPQVVCIARGQGHTAYGRWAKGIGVNPQDIIGVDYDRLSGQAAFGNTRVRVYRA
jgi:molybdopterin-containing oxidoreductase family iron-sulfur binding subunit